MIKERDAAGGGGSVGKKNQISKIMTGIFQGPLKQMDGIALMGPGLW